MRSYIMNSLESEDYLFYLNLLLIITNLPDQLHLDIIRLSICLFNKTIILKNH